MIAPPFDENDPNARTVDPQDPNSTVTPPPVAPPVAPPSQSPFNREGFRDAWMSTGTDVGRQNDLLRQNNLTADGAGRFTLPTGEVIDGRIGARAGVNQAAWTGVGPTAGGGAGAGGAGGGAMGEGGAGGGAGSGGYQGQVRAMLMQMLNGANTPVDENSAGVAQPYQAAKLAADRGVADEQKALAEQLYAQGGGGSNELTQGIQQSRERNATGLAGIKSQLIQRAVEQKQGQLQQALSLAVQSGDAESARALQLQIAQMSNALGQAQLGQQGSQWNDQYGLNKAIYKQNQNNSAADVMNG